MMNPEVKAKWIKALRSGEYEQGRGHLRSISNCFCCLGVLCDIYQKEHPETEWVVADYDKRVYEFDQESQVPPESVWKEWAQLDEPNPVVTLSNSLYTEGSLAGMNDLGDSFDQIANIIEEHL
jgi:hypothetical protein